MLSPSDILIRPTSLNERLAAEAQAEAAAASRTDADHHGGALRSRGAEGPGRGPVRPLARSAGDARASIPQRRRSSVGRPRAPARFAAGLAGADRADPGAVVAGRDQAAGTARRSERRRSGPIRREPSTPRSLPLPCLRSRRRRPSPDIVLTAPGRLEARTGDELDFDIAIDSDARAAGAERHRHPRHAGGRRLLARPTLRHDRVEPAARRDRRSASQAAARQQAAAPICGSS